MDESDFRLKIAIVGLGMVGGSYAKALRYVGARNIFGIDIDDRSLNQAKNQGIIGKASKDGKEFLKESDLVVMALYPEETIDFIKNNLDNFKSGAIITDVCGIKEKLIHDINEILIDGIEFVGGHPMAGNEFMGFDAASEQLFKNCSYIITPHPRNTEEGLMTVERIARAIGSKEIIRISPDEHDRIISFTSQLPHAIAISMMNLNIWDKSICPFMGGSIRDIIRVAALNKKLWSQAFFLNSINIKTQIEEIEKMLCKLRIVIENKDGIELERIFENSINRKREIA